MPEQKAHLLLVEDETPLRLALADLLADAGFHVVQAHAGEEAVAALSQFAFDIVPTDLRLPGLAGTGAPAAAPARHPPRSPAPSSCPASGCPAWPAPASSTPRSTATRTSSWWS